MEYRVKLEFNTNKGDTSMGGVVNAKSEAEAISKAKNLTLRAYPGCSIISAKASPVETATLS